MHTKMVASRVGSILLYFGILTPSALQVVGPERVKRFEQRLQRRATQMYESLDRRLSFLMKTIAVFALLIFACMLLTKHQTVELQPSVRASRWGLFRSVIGSAYILAFIVSVQFLFWRHRWAGYVARRVAGEGRIRTFVESMAMVAGIAGTVLQDLTD